MAIANLGWKDIKLTAPVFVGDTIYAESEVLDKRASNSRPTQGIVTVKTTGRKADGTVFMTYERSFLVQRDADGRLFLFDRAAKPGGTGGVRVLLLASSAIAANRSAESGHPARPRSTWPQSTAVAARRRHGPVHAGRGVHQLGVPIDE